MTSSGVGGAIRVGDIVVEPLYDGTAILTTDMWAGSDWTGHEHLLTNGRLVVPVGAFLVRTGDRLVLLDAGVGAMTDDMFSGGALLDSLARTGVTPAEIDTIVVSHMHTDHIGWLELDGAPVFANATIRLDPADWNFFVTAAPAHGRRANRMRAIADRVEMLDTDGVSVAPGITTRSTPGHTPGHTSTVISSGDERLIVLADALHCPAQLTETEWQFVSDVDPVLAVQTRRQLLRDAETPGTALLPCHFPGMQSARLVPAAGQRRWLLGA